MLHDFGRLQELQIRIFQQYTIMVSLSQLTILIDGEKLYMPMFIQNISTENSSDNINILNQMTYDRKSWPTFVGVVWLPGKIGR